MFDSEVVEVAEHHDSSTSTQTHFLKDVKLMFLAVNELGNPFINDSGDLYSIDTKQVANQNAVSALRQVQDIGMKQFEEYLEARFWTQVTPITDTIFNNNIYVFIKKKSRQTSKKGEHLKSAKNNVAQFSRLFIGCQSREEKLEQFFAHEYQGFPPTLSEKGEPRPVKF